MKVSIALLTWASREKKVAALKLYLYARFASVDTAGYFTVDMLDLPSKSAYRGLKQAVECGFIQKVKHGKYKIVAMHKICAALGLLNPKVIQLKPYYLLYFKAFIQAAHGRAFVEWLSRQMRGRKVVGDKPINQGQYALSLPASYLGYSLSKASRLRKTTWEKRMAKVLWEYKQRILSADKEAALLFKRRIGKDQWGNFFKEGYEEAFLIKSYSSSSFYKDILKEISASH